MHYDMKSLLRSLLCAVFAAGAAAGPADARPLDEVTASKTLRVVVYSDNAPFSWLVDGQPRGIDVDIAHEIARHIGVTPEIIARMTGEDVGDDLRFNVWKGPYSEGGVGDVMMHIPIDRELMSLNPEAVMGNSYFLETVALAYDPDQIDPPESFEVFENCKIGVQYATVADYFLLRFKDGALINNVAHFTEIEEGIDEFVRKVTAAILGVKSDIEGVLFSKGLKASFVEPPMPGLIRKDWPIGMAVKENSRDLHYAIGAALEEMQTDGTLEKIFAKYGVTYVSPRSR